MLHEILKSGNLGYDSGLLTFTSEALLPTSVYKQTKLDVVNFRAGSLTLEAPILSDPVLKTDPEELYGYRLNFMSMGGRRQIEIEDFDTYRQQLAWVVHPVSMTERLASFDELIQKLLLTDTYTNLNVDREIELRMNVRDQLSTQANLRYQYGIWTATNNFSYGDQMLKYLIGLSTGSIITTVDMPNWKYLAANLAKSI